MYRTGIPGGIIVWGVVIMATALTLAVAGNVAVADDGEKSESKPAGDGTAVPKGPAEEIPPIKADSNGKAAPKGKAEAKPSPAPAKRNGKERPAGKNEPTDYTPEREAAALMFAALHHPELTSLLGQLKENDPKEYQRAIRELFQASERLALIQERTPARYDLELDAWKLESRIRLLAARMAMGSDPGLEQELREVVAQQIDVRLSLLQLERREVETRLQKLNARIETTEKSRAELIQQGVDKVKRDAGKARPAAHAAKDKRQMEKKAAAEKKAANTESAGGQSSPAPGKADSGK